MKIICLIVLLMFIGFTAFAQESQYIYCEIVGTRNMASNKITITIDLGDKTKWFYENSVKDQKTGKNRVFNSMIDALNYMGRRKWELEQVYTFTNQNHHVVHYLLKKAHSKLESAERSELLLKE